MNDHLPPRVTCRPHPHAGAGLFAKEAIPAGEEIFSIKSPLAVVLDSPRLQDTCAYCCLINPRGQDDSPPGQGGDEDGNTTELKGCLGCKVVKYCSKDCQTRSWKQGHRGECKVFARLYPKVLPNTVRAVLRLLLPPATQSLPEWERGAFHALRSHVSQFRDQKTKNAEGLTTWETIDLMGQAARSYSGTKESLPVVQALIARVLINSHTLTTPKLDPLGLCLALPSALINHSCTPNTYIIFSGRSLHVRSLSALTADEELTLSYIDGTQPTLVRQAELSSRYFFNCTCPACTKNQTCSTPDPPPDAGIRALEARAIDLQAKANATKSSSPADTLSKIESALDLLHKHAPWQQPGAAIRHQAFLGALAVQDWPRALQHALVAHFSIEPVHYPMPGHPVRVVRAWVLLSLVTQIQFLVAAAEGHEAVPASATEKESVRPLLSFGVKWHLVRADLWRRVRQGVAVSYGADHAFAREVAIAGENMVVFGAGEADGDGSEAAIEREWTKLRKIADGGRI